MALASTAVLLLSAAAAALMAMAALRLPAAAAAAAPPAPIGQPGCETTCGNVSVPYPFGFGPSHCYWPGFNLTCDTLHQPPRLLLGDGSLWVDEISLWNHTVRVMGAGLIMNITGDDLASRVRWNASLDFGRSFRFREHGYLLSDRNVLVVAGCNVMATISAEIIGEETAKIVSGCASFCTNSDRYAGSMYRHSELKCTGTSSCCQAPLSSSCVPVPNGVQARWLYGGDHTLDRLTVPMIVVLVAEQGWWFDKEEEQGADDESEDIPLLLDFAVTQGLPPPPRIEGSRNNCSQDDVQRRVCKSEHSYCTVQDQG